MFDRFELLKERELNKKSQTDMAKAIGISTKQYGHKELGYSEFKRNEIEIISKELNLNSEKMQRIFFG